MAVSSSVITNFNKIPLKPEFTFRVSISTRISPFATYHARKKPVAPLRAYSTTIAAPDEIPERPADPRWKEIHGKNNWAGLLDPIDPALRAELLRYGDLAQACYEGFDSVGGGCKCKYKKNEFLASVDLEDCGYDVARYLYAKQGTGTLDLFKKLPFQRPWAGYVAVSNDERSAHMGHRDIVVAWNSEVLSFDSIWHEDLGILRKANSIPCPDPSVRVDSMLEQLYTAKDDRGDCCNLSLKEQVLVEITRLVTKYSDETDLSITLTGHDLGSALALLCAFDLAETGCNLTPSSCKAIPITVFPFSGPRVGNIRFNERLEMLGVRVLRVHNVHDIVPRVPGALINEQSWLGKVLPEGLVWSHVGKELALDHNNSPFIRALNSSSAHSLELLLHLIDGYHGSNERFRLASKRDLALLNKDNNLLKEHHGIPAYWRHSANKASRTKNDH